jgi:hypothetical protein
MQIPRNEGILNRVFGVFCISNDGVGHRYKLLAGRHKHLLEGFCSRNLFSSFDKAVGLALCQLAGA